MDRGLLLFLIGVPLPIIVLLFLLWQHGILGRQQKTPEHFRPRTGREFPYSRLNVIALRAHERKQFLAGLFRLNTK